MLAIPYLTAHGTPVQIRFRCLQDHDHKGHGKYQTVAGDPVRLYGVDSILNADREIHLTEGELDRLVLQQALGVHAVGVPGASTWQRRHRRMLAGFSRIYLWPDPDEAGARLVSTITSDLPRTRVVRLGADVTDTYLDGGRDALAAALADARGD